MDRAKFSRSKRENGRAVILLNRVGSSTNELVMLYYIIRSRSESISVFGVGKTTLIDNCSAITYNHQYFFVNHVLSSNCLNSLAADWIATRKNTYII